MPHINTRWKNHDRIFRKMRIREAMRMKEIRDAFDQLSIVDNVRISNRVNREISHGTRHRCFVIFDRLALAYRYTMDILETVCV